MDLAAARARELGLKGVTFPWRTIRGQECSGYWPAGTAAFHINADVADAVRRYIAATGDEEFEQGPGLELLVETARLWRSLGHHDAQGGFRIDRVTGPDEYTAIVDNNVFTNVMAARNMAVAADLAVRHPGRADELGVDDEEIASWRDAAAAIVVPYDRDARITQQCNGFTRLRKWDFADTPADQYPLLLHHHNYMLYSSQVIKQADLVFAIYLCGDRWTGSRRRGTSPTTRASPCATRRCRRRSRRSSRRRWAISSSPSTTSAETAFIDLRDLASNTRDGVHLAALSGVWHAIVGGFGGMRDSGKTLAFAPRLPSRLTRLRFGLLYRGRRLRVEVRHDQATYELLDGEPLEIIHHGEPITVEPGGPLKCPIPPAPQYPPPHQPHGREPAFAHGESHPLPQAPHGGGALPPCRRAERVSATQPEARLQTCA